MIYLFVILLSASTVNNGWLDGSYKYTSEQYKSIAECEAKRARVIEYASGLPTTTLISKCASGADVVEYHSYGKSQTDDGVKS